MSKSCHIQKLSTTNRKGKNSGFELHEHSTLVKVTTVIAAMVYVSLYIAKHFVDKNRANSTGEA